MDRAQIDVGPPLHAGLVCVWRVMLEYEAAQRNELRRLLSPDELARAEAFFYDRHRNRFIARRGALRILLGRYLQVDPRQIDFRYGAYGRAEIANPRGDLPLRFNLSHSGSMALIALTVHDSVGVDVERTRTIADLDQVARCFSPNELRAFRQLPQAQRLRAFFNGWTRKEAFVKACGEGLARDLDSFDVSLVPGQPARLLRIAGEATAANRWSLVAFEPAPGYIAAVAVEQPQIRLMLRDLVLFRDSQFEAEGTGLEPATGFPAPHFQ